MQQPNRVSQRMARTGRSNQLERRVATALQERGVTLARQVTILCCTPDIVCSQERTVVFVDGDFWHGRRAIESSLEEFAQSFGRHCRDFWTAKIVRNIARDQQQNRRLRRHGWSVIRVWEKDLLNDLDGCATLIVKRLQGRRRHFSRRSPGAI